MSTTTAMETRPIAHPDWHEFERLLKTLVKLARETYTPTTFLRRPTTGYNYLVLTPKIAAFFRKNDVFDFLADGTYGYCLEMESLAQLIELSFRWIGVEHQDLELPKVRMGKEEEMALRKGVWKEVDGLIRRGEEIGFRRGRWSVGVVNAPKGGDEKSANSDASPSE
ncbi:hypothetical protein K504DRAFT_505115 [Pleomassaria siparia CBS 279.74]|uniref:Uncharacterized protein n=1 Tax=Pleomassaria siparia CBS 279.74 TaxID=1314801 RepID=A0A6G1K0V4_9PLEO|nr:hypothetical protein K504DRAFT_505115 [Pleomassaria siparia CBS 279.74]